MNQSVPLRLVGAGLAHVLSDVLQPASQTVVNGTFYATYLGLFTSWPGFGLGLLMSQLIEPTYTGYARVKVQWGDEGVDGTQRPEVIGGLDQFQPSANGPASNIIGAFLADASTGGNLLAVGLFANNVNLGLVTDLLGVIPRVAMPGIANPDWGEVVGIN